MSTEGGTTTRTGRVVKLTPKMEGFLQEASKGKAAQLRKDVVSKALAVVRMVSLENTSVKDVQEKLDDLTQDQEKLTILEDDEGKNLEEEEKEIYLEFVNQENLTIVNSKNVAKAFVIQESVTPNDSVSQVGSIRSEVTTSSTSTTARRQALIDERTKQAELMSERLRLIHQAQIEEEKLKLEGLHQQLAQKEQMLKIERELELSKAKIDIISQATGDNISRVSRASKRRAGGSQVNKAPKKPKPILKLTTSSPNPDVAAPKFGQEPKSQKDLMNEVSEVKAQGPVKIEDMFERLAAAIDRNSRQTVQIEPQIFDGSILSYSLWRRNFEELVERDVKVERRFIYLLKYTTGAARECIENLAHLENIDAYTEGMKLLEERYGDKFLSYEAMKNKLDQWPVIKDGEGLQLRKLTDFLSTCANAMLKNPSLQILNTMPENHKLLLKLPRRIVDRWSSKVDEWQYGNQSTASSREYPPFTVFVEFLKRQARIELGAVKRMFNSKEGGPAKPAHVRMTEVEESQEISCFKTAASDNSNNCLCCNGSHTLESCTKFDSWNVKDRLQLSYDKKLCRSCLQGGHFAWECKQVQRCTNCQGRHHRLFHDDAYKPRHRYTKRTEETEQETTKEKKVVLATNVNNDNVTAHIVLVTISVKESEPLQVYCVVDNQSNACFVSKEVAQAIGAEGQRTLVELHTMAGVEDVELDKVEELVVQDKTGRVTLKLPPTYIKDGMETGHDQIPEPQDVARWAHLVKIADEFQPVDRNIPVGLLIGRNCFKGTKLVDFIPSKGAEPYAVKTELGWGIVGCMQPGNQEDKSTVWVHTTRTVEQSPAKMFEACSVEFKDQHAEGKLSQDDLKFIKCMEEGLTITEDGHLMLPLPLKTRGQVPDNSAQALGSLRSLKKKFQKDDSYKQKFVKKMEDLFVKGYAEPVTEDSAPGGKYHLTYHGVFHPKKIDELRVVFNGKRKFLGFVLNEILLQGPDQINSLIGVVCRFRKEIVTLTCDIEAMFYQVLVTPEDRDYLRFYWYPDGDIEAEPKEYRMRVHIFGATSSPGVANYALNKVAEMQEKKYGTETAEFIKDGFYVDDGVTAVVDDNKAINLMNNSRGMCAEGGFNLTKFSSNCKKVVEKIPEEIRAKDIKEWNIAKDILPQGFILGLFLCNEEDCIKFQVQLSPAPRTRRGILSTTSQVYDPLGLVSPFILEGRRILKELCKEGLGWDVPIKDELLKKWDNWLAQVPELEEIKFQRSYGTRGVEAAKIQELHHFADASLTGYGECSYLRLVYEDGQIETALVMAKSKVLPKLAVTVPRLELAAAVLAVRMARFLQEQMKMDRVTHHFWSDSKVVLGYINNDSKRFHVYVANRVANIREFSSPEQWHHVETQENPADIASRGASVAELKSSKLWHQGPAFLKEPKESWSDVIVTLDEEDPEIKKIAAYETEVIEDVIDWEKKFKNFSTWKSLVRAIAKTKQLAGHAKADKALTIVSTEEREESERFIIQQAQAKQFKKDIAALKWAKKNSDKELPGILKTGKLRKLDPFLDGDDIVRVGGRFKKGPWAYHLKHPVILSGDDHVSQLLMTRAHLQVAHCGREATLSALRVSGYWILAARRPIDSLIWKCVICRRFRGQAAKQKMGEIPEDRLDEVPPFTHVGVDYFGPYAIKQKRGTVKRYIVIYTCLVTRCTHLDKAYGMSTDEFINSYRRFVSRRGAIKTLRCDRGTNFVGAREDLERDLDDIIDDKVKQALVDSGCVFVKFKMNPPSASHMGGVWERPIGTGKRILNVLLHEHGHALDDDLMDTVVAETEGIMNSMPLTSIDVSGSDSLKPLTPAMLLTMKPSIAPPPLHKFDDSDLYSRRRWRRAQHVVNEFWKRWRHELLPKWQERKKWTGARRNLEVDDVVLMIDENSPRMTWPMGRISETFPGDDGLVRTVQVTTQKSSYRRPVHKLVVLIERSIPVMGAR